MSNRTHPTDSDGEWTVTLPATLRSRIDQRLPNTEFDSAEAYVNYAMESLLRELDQQDARADDVESDAVETDPDADGGASAVDSEAMEERLESLGYL